MKTVLRTGFFLAFLGMIMTKTQAQCSASNILIQNIEQIGTQTPGTCTVEFDLSFQMESNNGNKFIFFHGWEASVYPDFFDCVDGHPGSNGAIRPPEGDDLAASFINIGIDNSGTVPVLLSSYTPDPSFNLSTADSVVATVLPNGNTFFVVYGINATFPATCNAPFLIAFDFWSSQAASANSAQCVNCSVLYPMNYIDVNGFAFCGNLSFTGTITNSSTSALTGYTLIYADVNGDGFLADGVDVLIRDTTTFSIAAGPGTTVNISGVIPPVNINQDLIVLTQLTIPGSEAAAQVDVLTSTQCSPLPVLFRSFTASRLNNSSVTLKWETSTEIDNRGFAVFRNLGAGNWELVTFVSSLAPDGNSTSPITYRFTDNNNHRGISQYRLMQVDLNGTEKFSEIRTVRGFGQGSGIIVYPIPSGNGEVNVLFEDVETTRDISLIDMSGRSIRQWKSVSSNNLQISNLGSGVYSLRILDKKSGSIAVEKIVVSRN